MVKVLIPKLEAMVPPVKMLFARDVATVSTVESMLVVLLCSSTMTYSVRASPSVARCVLLVPWAPSAHHSQGAPPCSLRRAHRHESVLGTGTGRARVTRWGGRACTPPC